MGLPSAISDKIFPQAIGGTVWHGIKGFRNSPVGERRIGAITAVKLRAPVLGGNFGVWGGLFSTFDCGVKGLRKKEDPWNAIIAGFFTGGSLAIRGGFKAARNGAIGCAVLLAVIEGVGIGFQRMFAASTKLEVGFLIPGVIQDHRAISNRLLVAAAAAQPRKGCSCLDKTLYSEYINLIPEWVDTSLCSFKPTASTSASVFTMDCWLFLHIGGV
ncbi:hypothetical protein RRF57_002303 [Xylaria bambusicola]|uniref:Mitochondrial import inner membrane translocase subunit TIM17 n=1 Tax=Xylaria bambusicola TaxID=326684 RepID=A0AAN7Z4C4_9PEZI